MELKLRRKKPLGPEHVHLLLKKFDTLMVGTYGETGDAPKLHARPMSVACVEDDSSIVFITNIDTEKVDEALSPRRGHVSGQSRRRYLSAIGTFEILKDPERLKQLWSKQFDIWFDGPEDPKAVLMIFHPEEVELWDSSGVKALKYAFQMARALVTGERPDRDDDPEQHERVALH
jgi:general stress protein 26